MRVLCQNADKAQAVVKEFMKQFPGGEYHEAQCPRYHYIWRSTVKVGYYHFKEFDFCAVLNFSDDEIIFDFRGADPNYEEFSIGDEEELAEMLRIIQSFKKICYSINDKKEEPDEDFEKQDD